MTEKQWSAFMDWHKDNVYCPGAGNMMLLKKCWEAALEVKELDAPKWKPKQGEFVLVKVGRPGRAACAIASSETEIYVWHIKTGVMHICSETMKPFDFASIGKLWSEL